jgi:hypothetical protein
MPHSSTASWTRPGVCCQKSTGSILSRSTRNSRRVRCGVCRTRLPAPSRSSILFHSSKPQPSWANFSTSCQHSQAFARSGWASPRTGPAGSSTNGVGNPYPFSNFHEARFWTTESPATPPPSPAARRCPRPCSDSVQSRPDLRDLLPESSQISAQLPPSKKFQLVLNLDVLKSYCHESFDNG